MSDAGPRRSTLAGRTALVTGGSRGIGRSIALALAANGAAVVVGHHTGGGAADEVVDLVRSRGGRAISVGVDIQRRGEVETAFDRAVESFGLVDIVVANAGSSIRRSALETSDEELSRTLDIVVLGTFRTLQIGARRLVDAGSGGHLLAIGSIHADIPFPNALAYNIAKSGLNSLCRSMAAELITDGILVNVLVPGLTDTPGERAYRTEAEIVAAGAALPLGRLGSTAEVGDLAAFLVSHDNGYMSGSVVTADGGLSVSLGLAGVRSNPSRVESDR